MAELNFGIPGYDAISGMQRGFNYAETIRQNAAKYQAGQKYAAGDYAGAAQTQAQAGDIPAAQETQQFAQQQAAKGQAYIAQALPVFQAVAQAHANDPDKGAAAIGAAFDHIAQEAKMVTGASDQQLAQFKQGLMSDPQGTIQRLQMQIPATYQNVDGTLLAMRGNNVQQVYQAPKFGTAAYGTSLVPENQAAVDAINGPQQPAQVTPQGMQAPSGTPGAIIPTADPNAMHAVESGGNPNAVNPVSGAVGMSQTMPATLQSPGFGVAPAANNTAAEQQRVGDQYLQAMAQKYNGNAVFAHIAYDMGPGATDRWIANGAKFSALPKETQDYLGRIAVAQATQGQQAQPQGVAPQQGQARIGQPLSGGAPPIDPEAIKNDVRIWLASKGTINPQYGMGTLGAAQRIAFDTQKNALMKDLNVTPEDVASGQAIRKADQRSLGALQAQADQIKAFEGTASRNADLALSLLDKGGPQGQAPIVNKWTQEWRKWVSGDTNVSQYTAALGTFADEYAKVVAGQNGSTDTSRATAYSRINEAMNKGQIRDLIGVMKKEMQNRSDSNDEQIGEIKQRLGAPQSSSSVASPASGPKIRVFNPKTGKLE